MLPVRESASGISFAIKGQPWTSWPETFDCVTAGSSARQQLHHAAAAAAGGGCKQASKQPNKPNTSSALRMYFAHGLAGSGSAKGAHTHPLVRADTSSTHGFTECSFARRRSSLSSARLEFLAVSAVSSDAMQSIRCDRRTRLHAGGQAGRQAARERAGKVRAPSWLHERRKVVSLFLAFTRACDQIASQSIFWWKKRCVFLL